MGTDTVKKLFDIHDRVWVITGAAGTVGYNLSGYIASAGGRVAAIDVDKRVNELQNESENIRAYICNLTSQEDIEKTAADIVEDFGNLDVLVNLVCSFGKGLTVDNLSYSQWNRDIEINLNTTFLSCKVFGSHMKKNGHGRIINFASTASYFYVTGSPKASYCTSKAGIVMLTKSLAYEWAPYNINVNAIAPGFIDHRENKFAKDKNSPYSSAELDRIEKVPLKRFAGIKDLLGPIVLLGSIASDYITGEVIMVDGGCSILI
jgi:NAD(P)-dependent dehydrogenase (short-subunit alcohol dehydrogenase family)